MTDDMKSNVKAKYPKTNSSVLSKAGIYSQERREREIYLDTKGEIYTNWKV